MPDKEDNSKYLSERQELELQKLGLDREKAELEVRDLKRPWYRKPQYVLAALPTTLALVGIIAGIYTGYFREKIGNLEEQKKELALSNEKSQANLKELDNTVNQLNKETKIATEDLKQITNEKDTLLTAQRDLARQVASLNTDRSLSQNHLQRIKDEYTKIAERSKELTLKIGLLENDLSTADMKSLAEFWLGTNQKEDADLEENDDARTQIVNLFSQRPTKQKEYVSFFENTYLNPKVPSEKYISVASLLFELTKEPKYRKELLNLTTGYLRAFNTDRDKSYSALSKIAEFVKGLEARSYEISKEQSLSDEIQDIVLNELEKGVSTLTPGSVSVLWLFFRVSPGRPQFLYHSKQSVYLRVVKLARDVGMELDDSGLRNLRLFSQTAFLAVIADLIQNKKDTARFVRFVISAKSANSRTRQMMKLEVPGTRSEAEWKSWADKPKIKRLVELWFEDDFKTFKSNPDLLDKLVEEGEVD
jgi:hypothetical protein